MLPGDSVTVLRTSEICMMYTVTFSQTFFLFNIQHQSDAVCTTESISIVRGQ